MAAVPYQEGLCGVLAGLVAAGMCVVGSRCHTPFTLGGTRINQGPRERQSKGKPHRNSQCQLYLRIRFWRWFRRGRRWFRRRDGTEKAQAHLFLPGVMHTFETRPKRISCITCPKSFNGRKKQRVGVTCTNPSCLCASAFPGDSRSFCNTCWKESHPKLGHFLGGRVAARHQQPTGNLQEPQPSPQEEACAQQVQQQPQAAVEPW